MADNLADAWISVVIAEAAVAYAYALSGAKLPDDHRAVAADLYDAHEQARDNALLALTATGAPAIAIPTFFELPGPLDTPEQARELLASVEARLTVTYADLVALLALEQRQTGLDGVLLASQRAVQWGATPGPWGAADPSPDSAVS